MEIERTQNPEDQARPFQVPNQQKSGAVRRRLPTQEGFCKFQKFHRTGTYLQTPARCLQTVITTLLDPARFGY
jgi:hypothetical protein